MIDELVNQLVLADNTAFTKITTNDAYRACVHYVRGTEDRYILFKLSRSAVTFIHNYQSGNSYFIYMLQVEIGGTWNGTTKEVETGTVNYYAPMYGTNPVSGQEATYFANRTYSHKLWLDKYGFVWNMWNPYSDQYGSGFFMNLEFLPTVAKEYDDSSGSVFINILQAPYSYTAGTTFFKSGQYGVFNSDNYAIDVSNVARAFRNSGGDGKIYFDFAKFHKNPTTYTNPVISSTRMIICNKMYIGINDVIDWDDNGTTRNFIATDVGSANGNIGYYVAIPYSAAKTWD